MTSRSTFLAPKFDNQLINNIKIHSTPSPNSIFDSASQLSSKLNSNHGKIELFIYECFNFPKIVFSEQVLPLIEVLYLLVWIVKILFKSSFWTGVPSSRSTNNSVETGQWPPIFFFKHETWKASWIILLSRRFKVKASQIIFLWIWYNP